MTTPSNGTSHLVAGVTGTWWNGRPSEVTWSAWSGWFEITCTISPSRMHRAGKTRPSADDNATGCGILLEMAHAYETIAENGPLPERRQASARASRSRGRR